MIRHACVLGAFLARASSARFLARRTNHMPIRLGFAAVSATRGGAAPLRVNRSSSSSSVFAARPYPPLQFECAFCNVVVHLDCCDDAELESQGAANGARCRWCSETHHHARDLWLSEREAGWQSHVQGKALELITTHARVWKSKREYPLPYTRLI